MAVASSLRLCGWAGLAAAIWVGTGEALIQYLPGGELAGYAYLADIPMARQSLGHWISVFAAPFYIPGYWFLSRQFPKDKTLATAGFVIMSYAFIMGAVWMGGRIDLAIISHGIADGQGWGELQQQIANHNEPFVNVLRVAVLLWSGFWIWAITKGRSNFPKWMAIFSPIALLASIFGLYFAAPAIGGYVLPAAMNVSQFILFGLALWTTRSSAKGRRGNVK